MVNAYPREYLELWDIKQEMVKSTDEADRLKREWTKQGFVCSRKKYDFGFDVGYSVVGLRDKTRRKTKQDIRRELKEHV